MGNLTVRMRARRSMPTLMEARVAQAYTQVPPPDDPRFRLATQLEQTFSRGVPTHEEMDAIVERHRPLPIAESRLTEAKLQRLSQADAARLAAQRWQQQNPAWRELPDSMRQPSCPVTRRHHRLHPVASAISANAGSPRAGTVPGAPPPCAARRGYRPPPPRPFPTRHGAPGVLPASSGAPPRARHQDADRSGDGTQRRRVTPRSHWTCTKPPASAVQPPRLPTSHARSRRWRSEQGHTLRWRRSLT
jgi:hypothetical protein